jgi:hypothetical protein
LGSKSFDADREPSRFAAVKEARYPKMDGKSCRLELLRAGTEVRQGNFVDSYWED